MSSFYDNEPAYRIQKRLVLNQCYKAVSAEMGIQPPNLTYVTLGGAELYDVLDLLCVFDIRRSALSVVSYEINPDYARQARSCRVAQALSKMDTFNLEVVPHAIEYESIEALEGMRDHRPFIYFLDFFNPFAALNKETLFLLLSMNCIRPNDFVLITSSLTQRVLHQRGFMDKQKADFKHYFGLTTNDIDLQFKVRNHVDLLVAQAVIENSQGVTDGPLTNAKLMSKFRYQDTQTPMGVWLYKIEAVSGLPNRLVDQDFIEYPWPAIRPEAPAPEVEAATSKASRMFQRLAQKRLSRTDL